VPAGLLEVLLERLAQLLVRCRSRWLLSACFGRPWRLPGRPRRQAVGGGVRLPARCL